jgi:sulfonate transport system substrate-binding protein
MVVSRSASDRRTFLAGTIASLGLVPGLVGCRGKAGGTELVLGDQVHLVQAKLEAANALGSVPYRISWANFPGAAPLLEALNAGAVDTAPAGDLPVVLAAAAGCKLKIAAITRTATKSMAIIVPNGSPIGSVRDLAGKSVIVSSARGSISHYLLLEALREADVPVTAVKISFMLPNDAAAAFSTGQVDAWATFGIYQARAEAAGARILRDGAGIGPGYSMIAVSERALADAGKRGAVVDFLSRAQRANDWCRQNPGPYTALYARQAGVDPAIAQTMVSRENPGLSAPDEAFINAVQRAADRFLDQGVLPVRVRIADLVAPDLLRA